MADQDFTSETITNNVGDVIIEDNVWIGYRVYITEGVSIGENSVIGTNSVVTGDLPPHCIAAGSPAKVTKFKLYLDENKIRELKNEYSDVLSKTI